MGRKTRHKLVSAFVVGLVVISLAICEFRVLTGEFTIPSVTSSITRRELLTRHMWTPPKDITIVTDHLQILAKSVAPLAGEAPHEPPGTMGLAPIVQKAAPPIQPVTGAVPSPAPSITDRGPPSYQIEPPVYSRRAPNQSPILKAAPPPLVVQSPNVPTVAAPSSSSQPPIPASTPVSSLPLLNSHPLVAPSPVISQTVLSPVESAQPKEHTFSPTSIPSPYHENDTDHNFAASPHPKERQAQISKPNSSHAEAHVPVASPPKDVPAHASPENNSPSSTKATSSPTTIAPRPLETPIGLSPSNSTLGRAQPPIPASPPVSSLPLLNPAPLVAPSPEMSQTVLPPVESAQPKASPPPKERKARISKPNSSHAEAHVPVASPPKDVPAHASPENNSPSSTKATSSPTTIAPPPLETPIGLSPSNSILGRGRASPPVSTSPVRQRERVQNPVSAPPEETSRHVPRHNNSNEGSTTLVPTSPVRHRERVQGPVSAPPEETSRHFSNRNNSRKADEPSISPAPQKGNNATSTPPKRQRAHVVSPTGSAPPVSAHAPAPAVPFHQRKGKASSSPAPSPARPVQPRSRHKHHAPPIATPAPSISPSPVHSANREEEGPSPSPTSSRVLPYNHHKHKGAIHPPDPAPIALPQIIRALPPPPPNQYCTPLSCANPYTNSPSGSPCICVLPIKVGLRLSVSLYKFFNLVSELAQEIASGIKMKQSQVRVMGANAADEDTEKTDVLVDLVPLGEKFENISALLVFDKFYHKEVDIKPSYFGDYVVLYVLYPGLPPSPPVAPDSGMGNGNKGKSEHPLAADVSKQREKQKAGILAIIVLSSFFAFLLLVGAAWFVIVKLKYGSHLPGYTPSLTKASGTGAPSLTNHPSSITASFNSNMVTYKGTATTFTLFEMEKATHGFDESRLIGEGGFGRVYEGILGDGKLVAVKVLKRDDQQGSREFIAEVEMLSRLHHRNLVRLIGICSQEHLRCLVYELVPNGSVESHLYGADKETGPLDWDARLKIALGAARALAYLHEDSSPRVIHRDFKSSNILLEHDFTPKVSDFGLARAALGEENDHISTHVMGTFGYLAPEYAMTGHLLVKSDVYSYGVVLLELLTGLKSVDMLRPPGQENLVTWSRPLLTNQEGLESILDPFLGTVPFDSLAKVAAIASMCVQPEVDQRPFMGEVVQALKLVCNEGNGYSKAASETGTLENMAGTTSPELGVFGAASSSPRFERDASGSFRMYSGSGPLKMGHEVRVWDRGSSSEHGVASRFGMDLVGSEKYL